ncbi:FAD/NAD(P)-binding protein [Pedobacter endophyticus]|uniref:FAD/NAD(P)-binding protein n=1 Tax=Pedobacter endophyticus TaxID=2789740 RepID=A0A7S9L1P5_9SPHI|nr:FAD/NAD(P)-binding protein [Pedobacter endophyticus]QPH40884.1 FAD/NAD(P)-binding protein [Pedobacter endophyticus]
MHLNSAPLKIGIVGGGPTALLMFKKLLDHGDQNISVDIFEKKQLLGAGMPYSRHGALDEHVTNVSGNEIPALFSSVEEWIAKEHLHTLNRFKVDASHFNDYKVLPRLLFGRYLSDQFKALISRAKQANMVVNVHFGCEVTDIIDDEQAGVCHIVHTNGIHQFDRVIICSGHHWPTRHEGKVKGYFDSPYPPEKLAHRTDHPVAIRGSSLTAIDAIRTLARANGTFEKSENGDLSYILDQKSPNFSMLMHSRSGFLPAVRFHLEDSHLSKDAVLSADEIARVMAENDGFLPLDHVFKRNFLEPLAAADPAFYAQIKDLSIEQFVEKMMAERERLSAFELLALEIKEADRSIRERKSVNWKEMLAVLSYAMNYPAKHFSAEDMQRLKVSLMPLISVVIAFAPQSSVNELMALHQAGVLAIVSVGDNSEVLVNENGEIVYTYADASGKKINTVYQTFVDAIGQSHLEMKDIPYPSLLSAGTISPAMLKFNDQLLAQKSHESGDEKIIKYADGSYYQLVTGIAINDHFQVLDRYGATSGRIYMLAVPYIGGYNPDFSGLDFGEAAAKLVTASMFPIQESLEDELLT